MLHQAGVSFDLYYDARKHKFKNYYVFRAETFIQNILHFRLIDINTSSPPEERVKMREDKKKEDKIQTGKEKSIISEDKK